MSSAITKALLTNIIKYSATVFANFRLSFLNVEFPGSHLFQKHVGKFLRFIHLKYISIRLH